MTKLSAIIPARNERFLTPTIRDLLEKARGDIEVIAVLEGYWPSDDEIVNDPRVHYLHFAQPRGMRGALNAGVAISRGEFVMKLDAHCMLSEGFDTVLTKVCRPNWVCVPTRHRLEPVKWEINDGGRPPINYLYMDASNDGINFKEWRQKNKNRELDAIRIDDILSCQGSMYFMHRKFWDELELLDEEHYGSFRKDPQEVSFKAWTYGGRVVRVKDCWYAHLHKGKKYRRGYSTSRPDWDKGDEYVKKWLDDSAWDKQKIQFAQVMQKFSDMPGWEAKEPETTDKNLPDLYQHLEVAGKPFSKPRPDKASSRFWNEGKWESFVAPLLPDVCQGLTFVEMGSNAGLFLKIAKDVGFERVAGIEKNKTPVKEGLLFRDTIGYDYQLLKRKLGSQFHEKGTFDIDELPVADVTLMSTFHYYVDINAWLKYLDRLAAKSCRVIIISRPSLKDVHWRAGASYAAVSEYFSDWTEEGKIEGVPKEGDSKPRDLYSVVFKSPTIQRILIDDIDIRESPNDPMNIAMANLAQRVASGKPFDIFATDYYQRWKERKSGKWSDRTMRSFVQLKVSGMQSVVSDGLKDALIVERGTNRLIDGGHRLAMLRALGHKSVIVRPV